MSKQAVSLMAVVTLMACTRLIEAKENVKVEAATQTFATVTLQNYFRMYHKRCW